MNDRDLAELAFATLFFSMSAGIVTGIGGFIYWLAACGMACG